MIIDITAHKSFRRADTDEELEVALVPLAAQMEEILRNMSRSYEIAADTVRKVRGNRSPDLVARLAKQRVLIGNLLHNLGPLEPELVQAGEEFMRRYRPLTDDLRRISDDMDQELARPIVRIEQQGTAFEVGKLLASVTFVLSIIVMLHVIFE